jgi:hypothetical protein
MRFATMLFLISLSALAVGCQAPVAPQKPAFFVPTSIIRHNEIAANYLLPTNSAAESFIPRSNREAYGPQISEGTSYLIYTTDYQPIGAQNNGSYQYRYMYRSGLTFP